MSFFARKKERKTEYFPEKKPITDWWTISDVIAKELKDKPENIFAIENIDDILVEKIIANADFSISKTANLIAFKRENEKNLYELIQKINSELLEKTTEIEENLLRNNSIEITNENDALEKFKEYFPVEEEKNVRKSKPKLNRTIQKMTRFTPGEWKKIEKKIEKSGVSQGEYMREMLLKGTIKTINRPAINEEALQIVKKTAGEIGKIGGMIKVIMASNELSNEEIKRLEVVIEEFENMKKEWQSVAKKI